MKILITSLFFGLTLAVSSFAQTNVIATDSGTNVETIVCIRHGEKPHGGLGQLDCQGLNRSLALPPVLLGKFGTPQFIFACNPAEKPDLNPDYYYVRPLATIEPTAILCGLPVNTKYGFQEIKALEKELQKDKYRHATVFVAWEHHLLDEFSKNVVKDNGGNVQDVPEWSGKDFDMIFVFKFTTENGQKKFSFSVDHEGLNGLSDKYPVIQKGS
jgi:hypothetical protein